MTGHAHHLREAAVVRHAGGGVDLVEDDLALRRHEQVDARKAGAAEGRIDRLAGSAHAVEHVGGQLGGAAQLGVGARVLLQVDAEKAVAVHDDLVHLAHLGAVDGVAHDGAADLHARDALLHGDFLVESEGGIERLAVLGGVVCLGDTDGAAAAGGFHEHGVAAACLDHGILRLGRGAAIEHLTLGRTHAGGRGQAVRGVLVHAHGAGEHTAAHVGHAAGLEGALHGAVLASLTVKDRQRHIDLELAELAVDELHEAAAGLGAAAGNQDDRRAIVLFPGARHHIGHVSRVVEPRARAIDTDQYGHEALGGKRGDDVVGRLERDVVLGGDAAKDDCYVDHGVSLPIDAAAGRGRCAKNHYTWRMRDRMKIQNHTTG